MTLAKSLTDSLFCIFSFMLLIFSSVFAGSAAISSKSDTPLILSL